MSNSKSFDDTLSSKAINKILSLEDNLRKCCQQYGSLSYEIDEHNDWKLQYLNLYVENLFMLALEILSYNNGKVTITSDNIEFTKVLVSKIYLVRNNVYNDTNDMIVDYRISIFLKYITSEGEYKLYEVSSINDEKAFIIYDNIVLANDDICEQNREILATDRIVSVTIR